MFVLLLILLISSPSYAFLDFIGEQAKKAKEVAAYVDAASDLAREVTPDQDLEKSAKDIQRRAEVLRSEASDLSYLSRSTQSILKGPDWSSRRLETNIRSTTDYIRRLKRILSQAIALGTDGVVALNTTETNVALNEVQKNQQALIMQNSELQLREMEREQEEAKRWSDFSARQRKLRNGSEISGKL